MIELDGYHLSIGGVVRVSRKDEPVRLAQSASEALERSRAWVEEILSSGQPVYGINTGFGLFADTAISRENAGKLNRNLILSHAVGTGPFFPIETTRAAMLVRANTLARGFSGVRSALVAVLLEMLNKGVSPLVPSQGSLGSSGDLAPLAHLALVLSRGEKERDLESGRAIYEEEELSGLEAMRRAGIARIKLEAKEGLALTNGATFCAAIGALAVDCAETLLLSAEVAMAMSIEALRGCTDALDPRIHAARGQKGQERSARLLRDLVKGSRLVDSTGQVQDAYSLRCAPQVHGAVGDTLEFVRKMVERELNAATDNPLLFEPGVALSGGNFHGEPVGLAMDYLGIAAAEMAAISERRTYRLTDPALNNGLPAMLVNSDQAGGLNSGLMMPQYTAASLVLENRTLASPDSVNSLPTSGGQEDHNANAMASAVHCQSILHNAAYVLAVEAYTASRALFLRMRGQDQLRPGKAVLAAHDFLQSLSPYQPEDALWGIEIEKVKQAILSGEFIASAGLDASLLR